MILLLPLLCLYFLLLIWRTIFIALSPFRFPHLVFWCDPEDLVQLSVLCLLRSRPSHVCCVQVTAELSSSGIWVQDQPAGDVTCDFIVKPFLTDLVDVPSHTWWGFLCLC